MAGWLVSRVHDVYVAPHASVLFRNMSPKTRDAAAVAAAVSALGTGFGYRVERRATRLEKFDESRNDESYVARRMGCFVNPPRRPSP